MSKTNPDLTNTNFRPKSLRLKVCLIFLKSVRELLLMKQPSSSIKFLELIKMSSRRLSMLVTTQFEFRNKDLDFCQVSTLQRS